MKPYRCKISLSLTHPVLDPDEISTALGCSPQRSWKAGELRRTPAGVALEGTNDVSYWTCRLMESEENAADEYLESSLEDCISYLEGHQAFLTDFVSTGGKVALRLGWFLAGGTGGEILKSELLKRLGRLEVDLMLDIYDG